MTEMKHVLMGVGFRSQDALALAEIRRRITKEGDKAWEMHQSIALALADLLRGRPDGHRAFGGYPDEIRVILGDYAPWLLPPPDATPTAPEPLDVRPAEYDRIERNDAP